MISLVAAVLPLNLRRARLGEKRQNCFNVARLNETDIKQKYNIKNSYSVLQNETEMTIHAFNQVIREAGNTILSYWKTQKEEWISQPTWKAVSREYADKDREVKNKKK